MAYKRVKDYYDEVKAAFPDVPEKDVERVLNFGWKSLYLHNVYGGDTLLLDNMTNKYLFYIGKLTNNSLKHFYYYIKKMTVKLRVLYNRAKTKYDGYYYFALTDPQYENYLAQFNKRGRKRKKFNYGNQILYKMLSECKIKRYNRNHIFRVKYPMDVGFTIYQKNFETEDAEYLYSRETKGFSTLND